MKKYFLSSMLVMGLMAPAFGVDGTITGGPNTCTVDVLGVFENDATAKTIATWTPVTYECAPGQYLLETETSVECTPCPIGSYCPGGTYTVESDTNGATACPTDYTSDDGATAESECYIGCESVCSTNVTCPKNATCTNNTTLKVAGKQYFGGSCNSYPSFCPITSVECHIGFNKHTATKTVEEIRELKGRVGVQEYFSYCSANNISIPSISDSGCGSLEPGTVRFDNLDFTEMEFEIVFNDYGPETLGIQNFEYMVGDETFNAAYLENANFETSADGKYVWIRPIMEYTPVEDIVSSPGMALAKNYGVDKICNSMMDTYWLEKFLSLPEELLERFFLGNFNNEAELSAFIESEIIPYLSEEDATELKNTPISNIYLTIVVVRTAILHEDTLSALFFTNCDLISQYSTLEELQGILALLAISNGTRSYADIPWVLPDQRLMQALYLEEGTELTEEQIVLVRETLAIAADTAIAALESKGGLSESYCAGNEININWNPDNGTDNIQGMCHYGSDVLFPIPDPVKPGYTFTGWKLVE